MARRELSTCTQNAVNAPSLPFLAGGIADGRQVAAALVLGAQGAVIGTALAVAKESTFPQHKKAAILGAGSQAVPPGGLNFLFVSGVPRDGASCTGSALFRQRCRLCTTAASSACMCAGATVRSQVFDQLGPFGTWPQDKPVQIDGRSVRNSFLERTGIAPLQGQEADELQALKTELDRGKREEDASTDVVYAGASPLA